MDNLDYLKCSPALQFWKQLDTQHAIAQKIASQFDGILNSGAVVTAMMKDISSVAETHRAAHQTWEFEATPAAKAIEALHMNLTRGTASTVLGWEASHAESPTQRIIATMKRDWDLIADAEKSAQWAFEASSFAKIAESWAQDLARESASLGTAWKSVQSAWKLDAAHFANALQPPQIHNLQIAPAWAASISTEKIAPPTAVLYSTPQIQLPNNRLSRRPFSNYRMAESYDLLSDFEQDLRNFIHERMSDAFGSDWEKSRVPREMYKRWQEKRDKAYLAGEPRGLLIDYADFTDYVTIITQRNNWADLFQVYFRRADLVRESLYRLHPIRVCAMHSRVLSWKMLLILQTETTLLSERMWN